MHAGKHRCVQFGDIHSWRLFRTVICTSVKRYSTYSIPYVGELYDQSRCQANKVVKPTPGILGAHNVARCMGANWWLFCGVCSEEVCFVGLVSNHQDTENSFWCAASMIEPDLGQAKQILQDRLQRVSAYSVCIRR